MLKKLSIHFSDLLASFTILFSLVNLKDKRQYIEILLREVQKKYN